MLKTEEKFIDNLLQAGASLSSEWVGHQPRIFLRSLRKRLRMTQTQLAKRVGLPQSYIAKVESGVKKPTLDTWEKIFRGLYASITLLLIPEKMPAEILESQALEAAKKRVKYVAGTMALEEQLPSSEALREMVQEEKQRLLESKTTKIWD